MKEFLSVVSDMIGQLDQYGQYNQDTLRSLEVRYRELTCHERMESLQILDDLLQEDFKNYFYIMSTLLAVLKDEQIAFLIENKMLSERYPLWERLSNMLQLRGVLFMNQIIVDYYAEHEHQSKLYKNILNEIQILMGASYSYIPYHRRKKKIVIVVSQLLGIMHAPTKKVVYIYKYLRSLGYEIQVYVCCHLGKVTGDHIFWYNAVATNNFVNKSTEFNYSIEGECITGYNLILTPENYLRGLRETVGRIWDEQPEYVFEIGDRTILAGLCNLFTTVVTMNCIKAVPVTNAPIIARYFSYSEEEEIFYRKCIGENQRIIDVKHTCGEENQEVCMKEAYSKEFFGIPEDNFVIIIAGNRLNVEIDEIFLSVIYRILDQDESFLIAIIGECKQLENKISSSKYKEQIKFLGHQSNFKEAIAMGDVFVNPPRQGGGTGAFYAICSEVPVITLDNCDVESTVGKEFVCQSLEDMPLLVSKYFNDSEFMEKQKECCRKNTERLLDVNNLENFQELCDFVKSITLEREEVHES